MNRAQSSPFPMLVSLFITMIIGVTVVNSINEKLSMMPSDVSVIVVPLLVIAAIAIVPAMGRFMSDFLEEQ